MKNFTITILVALTLTLFSSNLWASNLLKVSASLGNAASEAVENGKYIFFIGVTSTLDERCVTFAPGTTVIIPLPIGPGETASYEFEHQTGEGCPSDHDYIKLGYYMQSPNESNPELFYTITFSWDTINLGYVLSQEESYALEYTVTGSQAGIGSDYTSEVIEN